MTTISARLQAVNARIDAAALRYARPRDSIALLAVSKTWPANAVREAFAAGQRLFGENYVQEALEKADALADLRAQGLQWHFIGPLQSNKTRRIAETCDWVHSIDRVKIAERLSQQRPLTLPPLQVCLQVNVSGESTKSGVPLAEVSALAHAVAQLPRLKLRGLMAIPAPADDFAQQRASFARLRECCEHMNSVGLPLDTLSMGMSDDLEAAIAEGATVVRIGSAIFGERQKL